MNIIENTIMNVEPRIEKNTMRIKENTQRNGEKPNDALRLFPIHLCSNPLNMATIRLDFKEKEKIKCTPHTCLHKLFIPQCEICQKKFKASEVTK